MTKVYISYIGLKSLTLVMVFLLTGAMVSKTEPISGGLILGIGFWECVCYTLPKLFEEIQIGEEHEINLEDYDLSKDDIEYLLTNADYNAWITEKLKYAPNVGVKVNRGVEEDKMQGINKWF